MRKLLYIASIILLVACQAPNPPNLQPEVLSLTVTPHTAILEVGEDLALEYEIVTVNGASEEVEWSTRFNTVVTVNQEGVVTALVPGTAEVVVRSVFDESKQDVSVITVPYPEDPDPEPEPEPDPEPEPEPEPTHVIGGILAEDTTLSDTTIPYVIEDTLQIPYGITLYIEPGVEVRGGRIQVWGRLYSDGLKGEHVVMDGVSIIGRGSPEEPYTIIFGHTTFTGQMQMLAPTGTDVYGTFYLGHSIIESEWSYVYMWYPLGVSVIEYNTFHSYVNFQIGFDSRSMTEGGRVEIRNNTFTSARIENWAAYGGTPLVVKNNNLVETYVVLRPNYDSAQIDARENYWGTTDEDVIQARIWDKNDNLEFASVIPYSPFLTEPVPVMPQER